MSRRIITTAIATILFVLCIWYIFNTYQWKELFIVIAKVDLLLLIFGAGFAILMFWLLRMLRWYFMLRSLGVSVKLRHLYFSTAISLSIALLTPLMSGEILKIELLNRQGIINRMSGYSTVALEKALDALTLFSMAIIGIPVLFASEFTPQYAGLLFLALILFALLGRMVIAYVELPGRFGIFVSNIRTLLYSVKHFYAVLGLTVAGWGIVVLGWMVCLISISINVNYQQTVGILGLITFANVFSFIPGGIGISEASSAELLIRMGYDAHRSQAGALMFRIYEVYMLLLGGIHFIIWRYFLTKN